MKGHEERSYRHNHNRLTGNTSMAMQGMKAIIASPSTTRHAKETANAVLAGLKLLDTELRDWRVEPDGSVTRVNHAK